MCSICQSVYADGFYLEAPHKRQVPVFTAWGSVCTSPWSHKSCFFFFVPHLCEFFTSRVSLVTAEKPQVLFWTSITGFNLNSVYTTRSALGSVSFCAHVAWSFKDNLWSQSEGVTIQITAIPRLLWGGGGQSAEWLIQTTPDPSTLLQEPYTSLSISPHPKTSPPPPLCALKWGGNHLFMTPSI